MTDYVWVAQRTTQHDTLAVYDCLLTAQARETERAGVGIDWILGASRDDFYIGYARGYTVRLTRCPFIADGGAS